MKRILKINNPEYYKILYVGFCVGGDKLAETGKSNARLMASIKSKLDNIGVVDELDNFMKLNGHDTQLSLTQQEFEKLDACLEKFEYRTIMVDKVSAVFDWFSAAEKIED
jgi:hypothetical protein